MNERTIFLEALGKDTSGGRAAYLDAACGGDAALRARVEALLRSHEDAGEFLDKPVPERLAGSALDDTHTSPAAPCTTDTATAVGRAGPQVGAVIARRYKLIEQIGEGGMDTVWLAEQTEPVKRAVAVKLIKPGMNSEQVLARFEAERQALALMDHPNIAKVHDAGTTPDGRPFFVMELVKGVPITQYCDDHRLTPRQRLELFVPVCLAVQHAHQKGIIHRDLKPTNVLVALYDDRPVPKVIDFGVAKAAGQQLTEKTLVTGFGAIVGTLEYMSPEQAEINQLDIDTRSDIYSLGVLLYELLTGSPPFTKKDLEKAGMLEMLRVIREEEPSKPSTKLSSSDALPTLSANRGTEPAKLTKLVRGELDWIVMKALEKDRNRRYETASGFAMDVQRYLADEPVLACPPTAGYRVRKFLRRNKGGLAVVALVLFFLVLLGSGIGWAWRDRSAREALATQQQAARQEKATGQVETIFTEVDRLEQEQKWPEALAAARRAEAAVASGEADVATAERVRQRLKDLEFIDRLEQIRIRKPSLREGKLPETNREYARAFRDYGVDVEELAVDASIDRLNSHPALTIPLAAAMDDWAYVLRDVSGTTDSVDWKRVVAVARGIDPDPQRDRMRSAWEKPYSQAWKDEMRMIAQSIDVRAQLPATLTSLGSMLLRTYDPAAAQFLRDAQQVYPGDFWINFYLGGALFLQTDFEGAIRYCTAAVAIRPRSGAAHANLGIVLQQVERLDEAVTAFHKALELEPKLVTVHYQLGYALRGQKKLPEAVEAFRNELAIDPRSIQACLGLGLVLSDQDKVSEALEAFRKAKEVFPDHFTINAGVSRAAISTAAKGRTADALRLLDELLDWPNRPGDYLRLDSRTTATCIQHFRTRGEVAACRAAVEALEKKNPADAESLYNAACCRALTAAAQAKAAGPDATRLAKEDADRAMDWLTKAVSAGFNGVNVVGVLRTNAELDHVRDRADFRNLMTELEAKDAPLIRARSCILLSQWDKAAAEYAKTDFLARRLYDDAFAYACLFLIRGDRDGYDRFYQGLIQQVGQNKALTPGEAFLLARTCAVGRKSSVDPAKAVEWANQAVPKARTPWEFHILGLAQYRAGQFNQAEQSFNRANVAAWRFRDLNWFGLALVHHGLGQHDEARQCLGKGVQWLEREGPGPGRPAKLLPQDLLEAQLLRSEAEERITPQSKEKPDKK